MARTLILAGLLLVASCRERAVPGVANATAATDTTPDWTLDASSLGKFRTGVTLAQFNTELGEQLAPTYEISTTCDHVDPASFPDGVIVMIENDSVARFDVENPPSGRGKAPGWVTWRPTWFVATGTGLWCRHTRTRDRTDTT